MPTSDQPPARFRSATEFPQAIEHLSPLDANQLYGEMRECLIFTNRSRGQLVRRNEEQKQTTLMLRGNVERLQSMVQQLATEKAQLSQANQQAMAGLQDEMTRMMGHLDQLSSAFDGVAEFDNSSQSPMSLVASPNRFFKFLRAVKAIVLWWRSESAFEPPLASFQSQLSSKKEEDPLHDKPQMKTDQASIGRSLLDK